jgi:hypothetical protein
MAVIIFSARQNHLSPYTHLDFMHGRFIPRLFSLSFVNLGKGKRIALVLASIRMAIQKSFG